MLDENKKVLDEIKQVKADKVSQTFAKMKPAASAQILSQMSASDASDIMMTLNAKISGQILGKMDPKKASDITDKLRKLPEATK
jgi:flagellar motility protein MotE (MotC chaperone)